MYTNHQNALKHKAGALIDLYLLPCYIKDSVTFNIVVALNLYLKIFHH